MRRIVSGLLTTTLLVINLPEDARAGKLTTWNLDENKNRLEIKLDQGTQIKAMVMFNPTRLVIDLPYTIGIPSKSQAPHSKGFSSIRISQVNPQMTRIVLELLPQYSWNIEKIEIKGILPHHWQIQLPKTITNQSRSSKTRYLEIPQPHLPKPKILKRSVFRGLVLSKKTLVCIDGNPQLISINIFIRQQRLSSIWTTAAVEN